LYRDPKRALDDALATGKMVAAWDAPDGVRHVLSKVVDGDAVRTIIDGVARSTLLIADGHHRYETALRYSQEQGAKASPRGRHRYFMTFLANGDDPSLVVFPTHRHVHDLARFDFDDLVAKARASVFDVEVRNDAPEAADLLAWIEAPPSRPAFVA